MKTLTCSLALLVPLAPAPDDPPGVVAPNLSGLLFDNKPRVLSFTNTATVPGVGTVRDEDLVTYDPDTGAWTLLFDGSDVGIGQAGDINAVHVDSTDGVVNAIYFSLSKANFDIVGLIGGPNGTQVKEADVIKFTPTSLGANTAGTMEFFLDGSDLGLTQAKKADIDGLFLFPTGEIAFSTKGHATTTAGLQKIADEDATLLTPTSLGAVTAGSLERYFDGSDVGFQVSGQQDVDGFHFHKNNELPGDPFLVAPDGMLFSTTGSWTGFFGSGADEDIGNFLGGFGPTTVGFTLFGLDLSVAGIDPLEDVDALSVLH